MLHRPPKEDPRRGIRPSNHLKLARHVQVTFESLQHVLLSGSPFSDLPAVTVTCCLEWYCIVQS